MQCRLALGGNTLSATDRTSPQTEYTRLDRTKL